MIQQMINFLSIKREESLLIYLILPAFLILSYCGASLAEMNNAFFFNESIARDSGIDYTQKALFVQGIAPSKNGQKSSSVEKNLQIRGTKIDAYRKAIELINNVWIDAETKIENFMLTSDVVRVKVQGMVRGLQSIGDPLYHNDGTMEQWYVFPLQGDFIQLFYGQETINSKIESGNNNQNRAIYSGLIVDCSGLGTNPALFPKIIDENGALLYSKESANYDSVLEYGLVGYHTDIDAALNDSRVADNPMKIVGIKAAGKGKTDIVITKSDADKIRSFGADHAIFNHCKVILVMDK
jgi:hypothetical protein